MALSYRRGKSRRRFAALSFLNNITLNGSHVDTKLSMFITVDNVNSTNIENRVYPHSEYVSHSQQDVTESKSCLNNSGVKLSENDSSIESEILSQLGQHKLPEGDFNRIGLSNILTPFRERYVRVN